MNLLDERKAGEMLMTSYEIVVIVLSSVTLVVLLIEAINGGKK